MASVSYLNRKGKYASYPLPTRYRCNEMPITSYFRFSLTAILYLISDRINIFAFNGRRFRKHIIRR